MLKPDIVRMLRAANPDVPAPILNRLVDAFFEAIIRQLASAGRVEIRGFGTFSTRDRVGRTGRNPRSGETVAIAAKRVPHFRPGKDLRERIAVAAG